MSNADKERKQATDKCKRPGCASPVPFALIEEQYALQIALCDLLGFLLISLPYNSSKEIARIVVTILRNDFKMELDGEMLFTLLRRRCGQSTPLHSILACVEAEHVANQNLAYELIAELHLLAVTGEVRNAEMLDYMLSIFFENQRRHVRWKNAVLLPLARLTLTAEDQAELQLWTASNGRLRYMKLSVAAVEDLCERHAFFTPRRRSASQTIHADRLPD